MSDYFSDRDQGPKSRTLEEISDTVWGGIYSVVNQRINDGSLGYGFPDFCSDGDGAIGCDTESLRLAVLAEFPGLNWPLRPHEFPDRYVVLDMLEFFHRCVAKPVQRDYHPFFRHWHLDYDVIKGQEAFRDDINRIFARNGIAFDLQPDGRIARLAPEFLRETLGGTRFATGDVELDRLLESARHDYLDSHLDTRKDSLDKLWGAWERLKSLQDPKNKSRSVEKLMDMASSDKEVRKILDEEARSLTGFGNNLMIRHKEKGKTPINESEMVDYLFHRMFAMILLLLKKSGRYDRDSRQTDSQGADDYVPF
jgi:hypothetical protein